MQFIRSHFLAVQTALIVVGIVVAYLIVSAVISTRFHRAEVRACGRLNIVRAAQNRTNRDAFAFDTLEAKLVEASLAKQTASVPRSAEQKAQTEQFIDKLKNVTVDLDWIALTDCHAAVYSADYQPPAPVRFSMAEPPQSVYGP